MTSGRRDSCPAGREQSPRNARLCDIPWLSWQAQTVHGMMRNPWWDDAESKIFLKKIGAMAKLREHALCYEEVPMF